MRLSTFHSLHAHSLTQSVGFQSAEAGTRWRTVGALLRPPPLSLVPISRSLTSRLRRHGYDVINGTSHGPPAAAASPPARACANGTASTSRSFRTPALPPALAVTITATPLQTQTFFAAELVLFNFHFINFLINAKFGKH